MTRREAAVAPRESATGAIYDLGYRGYDGPRLGRRAAVGDALLGQPARRLRARPLGALEDRAVGPDGRSSSSRPRWPGRSRPLRPGGLSPVQLRQLPVEPGSRSWRSSWPPRRPSWSSSDQRNHVLSLYFSHALARSDYALAKLGAMAAALFIVALAPLLVILFASILASTDAAGRGRRPAGQPAADPRARR